MKNKVVIIPYQEIIGNYSFPLPFARSGHIIPYQEIIGNYSFFLHNLL